MALIGFIRFCSDRGIDPEAVTQETLAEYVQWCHEWTLDGTIEKTVRLTAANWAWARANVPNWPGGQLTSPQLKEQYTLPLEAYPASFQADVKAYLDPLACTDLTFDDQVFAGPGPGRRGRRAVAPRTITTRLSQIRFAAAALVAHGVDPSEIRSLRDLVEPADRPRIILRFHMERLQKRRAERGEDFDPRDPRSSHLAGIADLLRQIAKYHCGLEDSRVQAITALKHRVSGKQQGTMSSKNRERLRRLVEPRTRAMLLHLARHWMRKAADPKMRRKDAACHALYATALEILLVCPLRRENLGELDILLSFHRDNGGRGRMTRLRVPASKVKNGVEIDWPLPTDSSRLIDTYLRKYRPVLLKDAGNSWLFPGRGLGHRNTHELGITLSERVTAEIGAKVHTHLFRHFAAWNFLSENPGQYEIARQALGHKEIETTIAFYAGLEADAAARHFDNSALRVKARTRAVADAAFRARTRRAPVKG